MLKPIQVVTCGASIALFATTASAQQAVADRAGASTSAATEGAVASKEAPKEFEGTTPAPYDEPDRLLLPGHVKHGGYGAMEVKLTTMTGEPAALVGVQGGWIINHGFIIGAAGYGLSSVHDAPQAFTPANTRSTLQFGYGGPRLGYVIRPHEVLHVSLGLLVGGGGYSILSRYEALDESQTHDGRAFFVMEPQAELEANLLRFLRVGFGVSYRYVGTKPVTDLGTSDLSGPTASLVVKAGSF